jgi:hypothetical protein
MMNYKWFNKSVMAGALAFAFVGGLSSQAAAAGGSCKLMSKGEKTQAKSNAQEGLEELRSALGHLQHVEAFVPKDQMEGYAPLQQKAFHLEYELRTLSFKGEFPDEVGAKKVTVKTYLHDIPWEVASPYSDLDNSRGYSVDEKTGLRVPTGWEDAVDEARGSYRKDERTEKLGDVARKARTLVSDFAKERDAGVASVAFADDEIDVVTSEKAVAPSKDEDEIDKELNKLFPASKDAAAAKLGKQVEEANDKVMVAIDKLKKAASRLISNDACARKMVAQKRAERRKALATAAAKKEAERKTAELLAPVVSKTKLLICEKTGFGCEDKAAAPKAAPESVATNATPGERPDLLMSVGAEQLQSVTPASGSAQSQ